MTSFTSSTLGSAATFSLSPYAMVWRLEVRAGQASAREEARRADMLAGRCGDGGGAVLVGDTRGGNPRVDAIMLWF